MPVHCHRSGAVGIAPKASGWKRSLGPSCRRLYKMELQGGLALDRAVESALLAGATTTEPSELLTTASPTAGASLRASSAGSPHAKSTSKAGSPRSAGGTGSGKLPTIGTGGAAAAAAKLLGTTGTFSGANKSAEFLTAAAGLRPKGRRAVAGGSLSCLLVAQAARLQGGS